MHLLFKFVRSFGNGGRYLQRPFATKNVS